MTFFWYKNYTKVVLKKTWTLSVIFKEKDLFQHDLPLIQDHLQLRTWTCVLSIQATSWINIQTFIFILKVGVVLDVSSSNLKDSWSCSILGTETFLCVYISIQFNYTCVLLNLCMWICVCKKEEHKTPYSLHILVL